MINPEDPLAVEDLCLAIGDYVTGQDLAIVDMLAAVAQALGFIRENARQRGEHNGVTEAEIAEFVERYMRKGASIEAAIFEQERQANAN